MVEQALEITLLPKTREAAERLELLWSRFVERNPDKIKARPDLARSGGKDWWMYQFKDETLDLIREGRLKAPTYIIWGADDPGAAYENGIELFKLVRQSVSRAQFHLFNSCSHWGFVDYPQDMTDLMVLFIRKSS